MLHSVYADHNRGLEISEGHQSKSWYRLTVYGHESCVKGLSLGLGLASNNEPGHINIFILLQASINLTRSVT